MDNEKIVEKARLTANGVGALAVGAPLFLADGFAHLGVGGMVVAGVCTFLAAKHTEDARNVGGKIMRQLVHIPGNAPSGQGQAEGRTFGEKLLGRSAKVRNLPDRADSLNGSILIGTDARGKNVYRTWSELKSILILGLAGGGKSSTASWLVAQCIRDGASIVLIDKHGRSDESLTAMLNPFEGFFACQPGYRPEDAFKNAQFVSQQLESRIEGESPCDTPLVLVIDEFSDIMRQIKQGGKWQQTGQELASLIEEINTQGRKYKVFVIAIGQIVNASRSGGTEIRDLFNTRMIHGMKASQAEMLLPKEYKQQVANLEVGQVFLEMEGKEEPFMVQVPLLSKKDMQAIASQCQDRMVEQADVWEDNEDEDADEDDGYPFSPSRERQPEPLAPAISDKIKIGTDATTKRDVTISKDQFEMLVAMRKNGVIKGYRGIVNVLPVSEQHAKNINKMVLSELGESESE